MLLVLMHQGKVSIMVLLRQYHVVLAGFAHSGLVLVNVPDCLSTTVVSEFVTRGNIVHTL